MFHSAGYFRAIPCPFFERGVCQRVHCHYRHAKPSTKAVERKNAPSIKSERPQQTNPSGRETRSKTLAPREVGASRSAPSGPLSEDEAGGDVNRSKTQTRGTTGSHNVRDALENNGRSAPTAADGSQDELTRVEADEQLTTGRDVSSVDEQSIDQTMLDIFGSSGEEEEGKRCKRSEEEEEVEEEGGGLEQELDDLPGGVDLAKIESDFIKATAQTATDGNSTTSHTSKEPPPAGIKRKRVAHVNAPQLRDTKPVRINPKKTISSGFSAVLDPLALQAHSHKKRVVRTEETSSLKRPTLPLTVNSRVPTKVRQKFLDAYIDEYLNMGKPAQEAYSMSLDRERQAFDKSNSHMAYMNTSANQLRRLRAEVKMKQPQQRAGEEEEEGAGSTAGADERRGTKRKGPLGGTKGAERADPGTTTTTPTKGNKVSVPPKKRSHEGGRNSPSEASFHEDGVGTKDTARGTGLGRRRADVPVQRGEQRGERGKSSQVEGGVDVRGVGAKVSLDKPQVSKPPDRPAKKLKLDKDPPSRAPPPRAPPSKNPPPRDPPPRAKDPPMLSDLRRSPDDDECFITDHTHPSSGAKDGAPPTTSKSSLATPTISTSQFYFRPTPDANSTTSAKGHMMGRNYVRNHSNSSSSSRESSGDPSGGSGDLSRRQQQASMAADMAELFGTSDTDQEEVWAPPEVSFEVALMGTDSCVKKGVKTSKGTSTVQTDSAPLAPPTPLSHDHKEQVASSPAHPQRGSSKAVEPLPSTLAPPPGGLINLTELASRHKALHPEPAKKPKKRAITPAKPLPPPPTYTILKKKTDFVLTGPIFYDYMKGYLLTEEQLSTNGYPRATAHEGTASIRRETDTTQTIQPVGPNAMRHACVRCGKAFIIYNSGGYQSVEECNYHFGRLRKSKEYGEGVVSVFSCCQGRRDSLGCQVAKMHVTAGEQLAQESGYVQALPAPVEPGYIPAVYSVDCEMCYTTKGLQLARVTVIDMNLHSVCEMLVKPSHPIVDYNTKFSGLTAESLASVETKIEDVQQQLLSLFYEDTILVGHSLESDLRALKFLHSTVVDTALVFPHPRGLPYKRALKSLIAEYLHRFIQDSVDGGHDSREDAAACMELMMWKVKTDMLKATRR